CLARDCTNPFSSLSLVDMVRTHRSFSSGWRRAMRRHELAAAVVWALLTGALAAQETTVERFVEFRDGSLLRLSVVDEAWKVTVLLPEGKFETRTVRLSAIQHLTL